jgi:RimJ/RimL family protein N-acetyltransferase
MDIVRLDATDDPALRSWHATYLAADTYERTAPTPWMLEELRADLTVERTGSRYVAFSGTVDGQVVTVAVAELPLKDNTQIAELGVYTHPARRRQGYAAQILARTEDHLRACGRKTAIAFIPFPYDLPADGTGSADVAFATERGYTFSLGDIQRVVDLPVDDTLLASLVAQTAPHHVGYTFRQWVDRVPDELVDSYGALIGLLATEAPMGEVQLEPQVFDEARIRSGAAALAAAGRRRYVTAALAPDGAVAAYTDVVVPRHDPGRAYQWGTLAHPDHRGRRLGLAVKARNLQHLQSHEPGLRLLSTYNAEVNEHMVEVNERLGFRPVERNGEFQKAL